MKRGHCTVDFFGLGMKPSSVLLFVLVLVSAKLILLVLDYHYVYILHCIQKDMKLIIYMYITV